MIGQIALLLLLFGPQSPVERATELIRRGQIEDAEHLLEVASSSPPAARKLRGMIAFHKRNYKTAVRELSSAIGSDQEGSAAYLESAALLGKSLYMTRDYPAASTWLEKVYRAGDTSAEVLQILGVSSIHCSRPALARETFAALYGVEPESPAAHVFTAQMMIREEFEDEAEIEVRKALELDPDFPGARFLAGQLAISRGEIQRAVEELKREISNNPTHSSAYYRLGDAYLRLNKLDDAIRELRRSIWLNPYFSSPYVLIGRAYFQKGDYANAEEMLRYSITIDPNNYAAYYMLGRVLVKLDRKEKAQEMFQKSRTLPRDRSTLP